MYIWLIIIILVIWVTWLFRYSSYQKEYLDNSQKRKNKLTAIRDYLEDHSTVPVLTNDFIMFNCEDCTISYMKQFTTLRERIILLYNLPNKEEYELTFVYIDGYLRNVKENNVTQKTISIPEQILVHKILEYCQRSWSNMQIKQKSSA